MLLKSSHQEYNSYPSIHFSIIHQTFHPHTNTTTTTTLDKVLTLTLFSGSEETSSCHSQPSPSPWHPGSHSPRPSPSHPAPASPHPSPSSWLPAPPHRLKAVPRKWTKSNTDQASSELVFGMKPLQGVRNYRKKLTRSYKKKTRNPCKEIKIGLFVLKLECNANPPWQKRVVRHVEPQRRVMRLETLVKKIENVRSRITVPINPWLRGRQDLYNLVKGPPSAPGSPVGVRVKSELKMVTETCTATVTCVTSAPRFAGKVKAETRTVTAETKSVPVRTMPITPTVARVKQETPLDRLKSATVTSLMSPEMQRVRMEIGPQNPLLGSSRDDRDANFISPRKRYMQRDFDNGSPSAKNRRLSVEHRLSTDSLGSTSDRSSPYRAPHSPHRGALSPGGASPRPSGKVSNFSIDSIMGGGGVPKAQLTPTRSSHPLPVAPTPTRPSPTPTKTPPPPSPFASLLGGYPGMLPLQQALIQQQIMQQQVLQQQMLQHAAAADPRIQQALQADPRLTPGSATAAYPFSPADPRLQALFPFGAFSPFASVASSMSSSQAPGGVWTPPVVTTATPSTPSTPPPATIAPPRQFASSPQHPPTPTSSSRIEGPGRPPSSLGTLGTPSLGTLGTPSRLPPSSMALAARLASPSQASRSSSPLGQQHNKTENQRPLDFLLQRAGAAQQQQQQQLQQQQANKQRSQDNEGELKSLDLTSL